MMWERSNTTGASQFGRPARVALGVNELRVARRQALDRAVLGQDFDGRLLQVAHDRGIAIALAKSLFVDVHVADRAGMSFLREG
jgi:hypothetical protein